MVLPHWQKRRRFGSPSLVALLRRSAARMRRWSPEHTGCFGDLSARGGGKITGHRSHRTGGMLTCFLFAKDVNGDPYLETRGMLRFGATGRAVGGGPRLGRHRPQFHRPRTSFLMPTGTGCFVKALLVGSGGGRRMDFLFEPLAVRVLTAAVRDGASSSLLARAEAVLQEPVGALPHDDHMHVVYCSAETARLGCRDRRLKPWLKKHRKPPASSAPLARETPGALTYVPANPTAGRGRLSRVELATPAQPCRQVKDSRRQIKTFFPRLTNERRPHSGPLVPLNR